MIQADIAIVGGGIAGLWLMNCLRDSGFSTVLVEQNGLGAGQTLASQGMIHGGLKYNLGGSASSAGRVIGSMPEAWRRHLAGDAVPNLSNVRLLAERYHLFSDGALSGRLTAFIGASAVAGGTRRIRKDELPEPFTDPRFRGVVYELPDAVLDTNSLIAALAAPHQPCLIRGRAQTICGSSDNVEGIRIDDDLTIRAGLYILTAGEGNDALVTNCGFPVEMQRRPLHQVLVKAPELPRVYAHAVSLASGDKPRLTITTHDCRDGERVWYLGGELAESGVSRSVDAQINKARIELAKLMPFVDLDDADWATLRVDRAEFSQTGRTRPDTPYCGRHGNAIIVWPTKLTLVPMMAEEVMDLITETPTIPFSQPAGIELAHAAEPPWELCFP